MRIDEILTHCGNCFVFAAWLIVIAAIGLAVEWVIGKAEERMKGTCSSLFRILRLAALWLLALDCLALVWFASCLTFLFIHPSHGIWQPLSI